jgi:hypothetical protein
MVGVAARYGETGASPYLLPLSVDGLIVVASICLVELGGRISVEQAEKAGPAEKAARAEEPAVVTVAPTGTSRRTSQAGSRSLGSEHPGPDESVPNDSVPTSPTPTSPVPVGPAAAPRRAAATGTPRKRASAGGPAGTSSSARPRRPITETAALAAAIQEARPDASDADVAQELGITAARLRTIRRQVRELDLVA